MRTTELVDGFRHSAPYVNAHRGKTFVVMLGGEALAQNHFRAILNDVALLHSLGIKVVLVYGARPQIDAALAVNGIEPAYHEGVRITDEDSLKVIKQVAGALQFDITARLSMSLSNTPMQGAQINLVSGNFVIAQPLGVDNGVDFCLSGKVRRIDVQGLKRQLDNHCIVLMGPIAASVTGESFNLTAEEIATQVAIKLKADKMIGFSSQNGILDRNGDVIAELMPNDAQNIMNKLAEQGSACIGTMAFLKASIDACRNGVPRCHLVSYLEDGALLQELFSREGIGTQIVTESAERLRCASIADIGGVLNLIRPLEEQGILVRRSREQLEIEIEQFMLIERDGLVIGCAALYPFEEDNAGEFACLVVHPDYRDADRGSLLLKNIINQARNRGYSRLFALTTRSIHWFLEHGFVIEDVEALPQKKKQLYNYQRRSKILALDL
ncbi:MAG: amino-acid N-acetyltransferase [Gammaproteobacteria bacterium]|uniref:Amino-acid acetyltransferase n=1 Tax=Shewanella septentrionalis TaxID=2952223 RepID=A0A9X3B1C8_9GAMM|nr:MULTISPECIES: amino-acid N-acetyltransferase [Shewanella]MBU1391588.1 amino-acid N-acetyltransferase [Gammaproteobacteria bacterium]MCT7947510.1 amino-acid N-acetyltransferase [Shewanella septentrionalis]AUD58109.1 amino-acid N-acetyltransferase [Shewanella sp. Pdp11]MBU1477637.1 amino-acid N-acetyltransferase [Gammaproteobacteria bacterium]MBU2002527.1 amino-acid N-acetyltransferase [Gammaproteobacteria bacterium]